MKATKKRLNLGRETIRELDRPKLWRVRGGDEPGPAGGNTSQHGLTCTWPDPP